MTPVGTFNGDRDRRGNIKVKPVDGGRTVVLRDTGDYKIRPGQKVEYQVTGRGDYVDFGVIPNLRPTTQRIIPPADNSPIGQLEQELAKRGNSPFLVDRLVATVTDYARATYPDFSGIGVERERYFDTIHVYVQCGDKKRELFKSHRGSKGLGLLSPEYEFEIPGRLERASMLKVMSGGLDITQIIGAFTQFPYDRAGEIARFGGDFGGKGRGILKLRENSRALQYIIPATLLVGADFDDIQTLVGESRKLRFPVVVRSSSLIEGGKGLSGSGLFESVFIGEPDELAEAFESVRDSVHSASVVAYMRKHELKPEDVRMGVVVQEVVGQDYLGSQPQFRDYPKTPFVSGIIKSRMEYESDKAQVFGAFGLGTRIMANREAVSSKKIPLEPGRYTIVDLEKFENKQPQDKMDVVAASGKVREGQVPRDYVSYNPLDFVPLARLVWIANQLERLQGAPVIMEYVLTSVNDYRPILALVQLEVIRAERDLTPLRMGQPSYDDIIAQSRNTMGHGEARVGNIVHFPKLVGIDERDLVRMHEKLADLNVSLPPGYCLIYTDKIGSRANNASMQLVDYSTIHNAGVLVEAVPSNEATNCSHLGRVLDEQNLLYLSDPTDRLQTLMRMFPNPQPFSFGDHQVYVFDTGGSVFAQVDSTIKPTGYALVYRQH
ncbi:hypothetical protein A3K63_04730 [Candidatus Micrarchaeota archaeon RBG_16_49_10]|nr:MAG: hypothetical protein A3K63_04730 [Candidatus Micrarchaeota archaeon RBG_16_49_10]